ncbi:MAG: hypothetical protein JWN71_2264 [Xanthobacteraceae bacterium]|jgi:hypothetical protein|nr:hypothetical protein [Xanthobacteraceae bacterium]
MGTVISFPEQVSTARGGEAPQRAAAGSATVIILPTIRIERHVEAPSAGNDSATGTSAGRRRRGRASRS